MKGVEMSKSYRKIVHVRQQEENRAQSNQAQKHTTHRTLPTCRQLNLTLPVASKGRQSHEATTNEIRHAQCHELAVGAELHGGEADGPSEVLNGDVGLEEAEESDEEGGAHGLADVLHVGGNEGPAEGEETAGGGFDGADNGHTFVVPVESPAEDGGEDDNYEAVGDVSYGGVSRLKLVLDLSTRCISIINQA